MLPVWGTGQPPLALRDQRCLYWPGVMLYPARYLGTFWCRFPHVLNLKKLKVLANWDFT